MTLGGDGLRPGRRVGADLARAVEDACYSARSGSVVQAGLPP